MKENGVVIYLGDPVIIDVPGGILSNDLFVEVEGVIQNDYSIIADEIELEQIGFESNVDHINLQGIISDFTDLMNNFALNGQTIDASTAELSPTNAAASLADGVNVEVEGSIVSGVLIADRLELRQGSIKMRTYVLLNDYPINTFKVYYPGLAGSITVSVDTQTRFEDDVLGLELFSLADIDPNDFVRVEGIEINGQVTASIVKRRNPDETVLKGKVEDYVTDATITILGIIFNVGIATQYYLDGIMSDSSTFFNSPALTGQIVEIVDTDANGVADKVGWES